MSKILSDKPTGWNSRIASWQKMREVSAGVHFYVAKEASAAGEARAKYRLQKSLAENVIRRDQKQ
jgi:hypothetical protein